MEMSNASQILETIGQITDGRYLNTAEVELLAQSLSRTATLPLSKLNIEDLHNLQTIIKEVLFFEITIDMKNTVVKYKKLLIDVFSGNEHASRCPAIV